MGSELAKLTLPLSMYDLSCHSTATATLYKDFLYITVGYLTDLIYKSSEKCGMPHIHQTFLVERTWDFQPSPATLFSKIISSTCSVGMDGIRIHECNSKFCILTKILITVIRNLKLCLF